MRKFTIHIVSIPRAMRYLLTTALSPQSPAPSRVISVPLSISPDYFAGCTVIVMVPVAFSVTVGIIMNEPVPKLTVCESVPSI